MIQNHPTISTQIVRHVRNCLDLAGVQSDSLLEQHGILPQLVDDREGNVALGDYVRFFEAAATATGNPFFGLHAARLMSADGLGPLSFLFLSAPSLRQAFETFTEYLDAMQGATFNAFTIDGSTCNFSYAIRDESISPRRQDAEYSIGVMCNLVRQYIGRNIAPYEVHFEHQRQGALGSYESYFGCQVFFEQPHNRLYLSREFLELRPSTLSPELFPIIASHLRLRMHGHDPSVTTADRVRDMLMADPPESLPGLNETAKRLGWSRTTLMRRLNREGIRFGMLVEERKLRFAQHLMIGSDRSIADIALASGFSENASFSRAFNRRIGVKPSVWRRQQKTPPVL